MESILVNGCKGREDWKHIRLKKLHEQYINIIFLWYSSTRAAIMWTSDYKKEFICD